MSTTSQFQVKPDYYTSKTDCRESKREKIQTNPRYRDFTQTNFTAGDPEQFDTYRNAVNPRNPSGEFVSLDKNIFSDYTQNIWHGYKNLNASSVDNTFFYIFNKFKKGIYVQIRDNSLKVFLPFSKTHFVNEWGDRIKADPKYGNMMDFFRYVNDLDGRYKFQPSRVNVHPDTWFGNNCLVRYEKPLSEGENNVSNVKNMLEFLCSARKVPDLEFFINRRDFPLLTVDNTESYNHLWDSKDHPLVSHKYTQYSPILSMVTTDKHADLPIPTHEDWARVWSGERWFPPSCKDYPKHFPFPWSKKIPTAVFRGGSTGCGVTVDTNARLKLAYLSFTQPVSEGTPYLDAGITNWNLRPRKLEGNPYLTTIDPKSLPFGLVKELTPEQQSEYKYIINVDGHVSAFRLSLELNMGSVILLVDSPWKMWYKDMIKPYVHYVPVKGDLSDIIDIIQWCRDNDDKCEEIASNAREFYNRYLSINGILDYMQKTLVSLKEEVGMYLYNTVTPLECQIREENSSLLYPHPHTDKTNIGSIPMTSRSYNTLKGLEWIVNFIVKTGKQNFIPDGDVLFTNKLSVVYSTSIASLPVVRKITKDSRKVREHIHETFVGINAINSLVSKIPNFAYVFAGYEDSNGFSVLTEQILGETLFKYISGNKFNMKEFVLILIQVCLALHVAQESIALVHYDLTPWNIMLQRFSKPVSFDYIVGKRILRIQTNVVPVIIDYGKSHVIYNKKHYGFVDMFKVSTIQDVLTLLITSMRQISSIRLPPEDFTTLMKLADFLSGTGYRSDKFRSASELRDFLHKKSQYSTLLYDSKHELENRKPMDLVNYIVRNLPYKFPLTAVKYFNDVMSRGNAKQVFDYILSSDLKERLDSYSNVFYNIRHCTIPQPKNAFLIYYAAQVMDTTLVSVRNEMTDFMSSNMIQENSRIKDADDTIAFIRNLYKNLLAKTPDDDLKYEIHNSESLIPAPYTQTTFLEPEEILELVEKFEDNDLSEYKCMVAKVLYHKGYFSLPDSVREYYERNFSRLLDTKGVNMQNNTANVKTLRDLAMDIYNENLETLHTIQDGPYKTDVEKYKTLYKNVIHKIQTEK